MIKTVIFDIGKVLAYYDWDEFFHKLFTDEETIRIVRDAMFGHGVWRELDRGVWTEEQLMEGFISAAPDYEKEIRFFYEESPHSLTLQPYAFRWITEVKEAGYQVLYLSNYSKHIMRGNPEALSFLPLMDGGIFSCDVHMVKPEREIYQKICDVYSLNPGECVFIDDHEENAAASRAFGFHTIHYVTFEQAYAELQKILAEHRCI